MKVISKSRFKTSHLMRTTAYALCVVTTLCLCVQSSQAEDVTTKPSTPKNLVSGFFDKKLSVRNPFEGKVVSVDEYTVSEDQAKKEQEEKEKQKKAEQEKLEAEKKAALGRTSEEAPQQFKDLVTAWRLGNITEAKKYADQYVDYMVGLMFDVKQISAFIGESLVKRGSVEEDDMVGVGQYLDVGFANARENNGFLLKPTHEEALKRVKPDPKNEVEIYYFFTLSCTYCRYMSPDVERLWQVVKGDSRLKMVALTVGPESKPWVESYRSYTGLSLPIFNGEKLAKSFNVGFVPALVVVTPNLNIAYLRSGETNFKRMYEFVRKAQGLPAEITPEIQALMSKPIGDMERQSLAKGQFIVADKTGSRQGQGKAEASSQGKQEGNNRF